MWLCNLITKYRSEELHVALNNSLLSLIVAATIRLLPFASFRIFSFLLVCGRDWYSVVCLGTTKIEASGANMSIRECISSVKISEVYLNNNFSKRYANHFKIRTEHFRVRMVHLFYIFLILI